MKKLSVAIIGCGGRGGTTYGRIMHKHFHDRYDITALCDINPAVLNCQAELLEVSEENLFLDENKFFEKRRADILIIGTQDRDHARMALKAMELGYDILVEKPLTSSAEECAKLLETQKKYGNKVMVCHVLRYAPAFTKLQQLLDSGVIGKLVSIDVLEQVYYLHYSHSFVRGNWHSEEETSPMILAKCCHDLDLIQHYAGAPCKTVSSVGDLVWFKRENAPEGHAERCLDCKYVDTCPYSAKRIYLDKWRKDNDYVFTRILVYPNPLNEEEIMRAIREGRYGQCAYCCNNDVVDHQLVSMTFENGVTANLTMMGFTGDGGRVIRLFGTLGEIDLDEESGVVKQKIFGGEHTTWNIDDLVHDEAQAHGGGDYMLMRDMYDMVTGKIEPPTALSESIESHLIGIAAEVSRHEGGKLTKVH